MESLCLCKGKFDSQSPGIAQNCLLHVGCEMPQDDTKCCGIFFTARGFFSLHVGFSQIGVDFLQISRNLIIILENWKVVRANP